VKRLSDEISFRFGLDLQVRVPQNWRAHARILQSAKNIKKGQASFSDFLRKTPPRELTSWSAGGITLPAPAWLAGIPLARQMKQT
jgi:hypothetical protein